MRVFKNRAEAEGAGFFVSTVAYPWSAYNRATPPERQGDTRTDLEAQLAASLVAVEWGGNRSSFPEGKDGRRYSVGRCCPACREPFAAGLHADNCHLAAALKTSRGET